MITAFINKRGENNLPRVFPGRSGPNQTHREPLINAQTGGCLSEEDRGILFHFQRRNPERDADAHTHNQPGNLIIIPQDHNKSLHFGQLITGAGCGRGRCNYGTSDAHHQGLRLTTPRICSGARSELLMLSD